MIQDNNANLKIVCKLCNTELRVPHKQFVADFNVKNSTAPKPTPPPKVSNKKENVIFGIFKKKEN